MSHSPPTCAGCDSDDMLCSCVESMNATYERTLIGRDRQIRHQTLEAFIDHKIEFASMFDSDAIRAGMNLPCPEDCGDVPRAEREQWCN